MIKPYLIILGMVLLFSACVRQTDMQTEGADFIQGVWVQDSIPQQENMLKYTLHEFKFVCDSFYVKLHTHAKIKNIPDSCFNNGSWTEFAKGVYVVRGDSIITDGLYTKPNWKQKISGCYNSGQYLPRFKINYQSKDTIILENRYDQRRLILRKTQDIHCVPKRRWEY